MFLMYSDVALIQAVLFGFDAKVIFVGITNVGDVQEEIASLLIFRTHNR